MEEKKSKMPFSPGLVFVPLTAVMYFVLNHLYRDAFSGRIVVLPGLACIALILAYYYFFDGKKRLLAAALCVLAVAIAAAFVLALPKHTYPQAVDMLLEENPELAGAEQTESEVQQLMTTEKYVVAFRTGSEWRHFIVDPDTLSYYESGNPLLW